MSVATIVCEAHVMSVADSQKEQVIVERMRTGNSREDAPSSTIRGRKIIDSCVDIVDD